MDVQSQLFEQQGLRRIPKPISAELADIPRLTGQNKKILEILEQGPVSNVQLSKIALKYTSRISDLRRYLAKWYPGKNIVRYSDPERRGVNFYKLESK